ncbi:ATP-binding cassette domain-containing protein [Actinomyces qiguomingii]|uniref:ATP-binding cassette domain-containing protein n=1 Tax=Actinomyces qiguomingii TaxID=2057800 RepID=UPI0022B86574|nr:ATP-binding cassette domain-containing protein [Actinomyces qiguomingii]
MRGLCKSFGGKRVFEDVTFDVAEGRVVGLLGRNGAGKTTTPRTTLGLYRADAGEARGIGSWTAWLRLDCLKRALRRSEHRDPVPVRGRHPAGPHPPITPLARKSP